MARRISKRAADQLWSTLREAFARIEETLPKIVEQRAWEPLGYATFKEAWADRMAGMRLATDEARALIVYTLIDEGADDAGVIAALHGQVGDTAVASLREQRASGVPHSLATTRVRSHDRAKPSPRSTLHIGFTPEELASLEAIAEARGRRLDDEARKAIRSHFRRLERVQ